MKPYALDFNAHDSQHLMSHELGHALAIDHYDALFEDFHQVMHSSDFSALSYRSGDRNGLKYLADNGFRSNPFGNFDSATAIQGGITVTGWAIDPNTTSPIQVRITTGGRGASIVAGRYRADVGAAYPASGPYHGFSISIQAAPGTQSVCVTALNVLAGTANTSLGCLSAAVVSSAYFADVDGPGLLGGLPRADAIAVNSDKIAARRSDGTVFGPNQSWTPDPFYGTVGTFFADVTGDLKSDALAVNNTGITIRRSTGTAFGINETWTSNAYFGGLATWFADITGDALADAVAINDTGIAVRRSAGTSFAPNEVWTTAAFYGTKGTFVSDVTGDRLADAIAVNDTGITVRRSTTAAFGANETWSTIGFYGTRGTFFADVTGDGFADAIAVNDTGITIRRSTAAAFGANETWSTIGFYGTRGTFFADVTGDRLADAIAVNDTGITVRRSTGTAFGPNETWSTIGFYGTH